MICRNTQHRVWSAKNSDNNNRVKSNKSDWLYVRLGKWCKHCVFFS